MHTSDKNMHWEAYREEIAKLGHLPEDWYVLGIDLGTTNSVISYWDNAQGRPEAIDISNGFGKIPLPSVVQYRPEDDHDEWVIGEEAFRSMKIYPETTIRSIKRKMDSIILVSPFLFSYVQYLSIKCRTSRTARFARVFSPPREYTSLMENSSLQPLAAFKVLTICAEKAASSKTFSTNKFGLGLRWKMVDEPCKRLPKKSSSHQGEIDNLRIFLHWDRHLSHMEFTGSQQA